MSLEVEECIPLKSILVASISHLGFVGPELWLDRRVEGARVRRLLKELVLGMGAGHLPPALWPESTRTVSGPHLRLSK